MEMLSQHPQVVFLGQSVRYKGTAMFNTLRNVPMTQRVELPVAEEMQMGFTVGLALDGFIPVSIYPRWNFVLCATNEVVNHLDKLALMWPPRTKVIVRTGVGSIRPMHPQHQHTGDFTEAFRLMCPNMEVVRLDEPDDIVPAYEKALHREDGKSSILVEVSDSYNEK